MKLVRSARNTFSRIGSLIKWSTVSLIYNGNTCQYVLYVHYLHNVEDYIVAAFFYLYAVLRYDRDIAMHMERDTFNTRGTLLQFAQYPFFVVNNHFDTDASVLRSKV